MVGWLVDCCAEDHGRTARKVSFLPSVEQVDDKGSLIRVASILEEVSWEKEVGVVYNGIRVFTSLY